MKNNDDILYMVEDGVAWITINQPEKMNRLTFTHGMPRLVDCVERACKDTGVKVFIITGAGDKAFCAGASIDQFEQESILMNIENADAFADVCRVFTRVKKPSIAMINGLAFAGGCGLAILPTFSIASENAVFACPEIKVGVWPMMVMAILFRTVGRKKGLELICTGDTIDAFEAERIGMINRVVPRDALRANVMELADKLKSKSSSVMQLGLEAFHNINDMEYHKALSYLRNMIAIVSNTPDAIEGTRAFVEKRSPRWES